MPSFEGVRDEHHRLFIIAELSGCGTCQSGPGGNRTPVRTTYLTHAKISMLNISGISRNIQFKAIFRLSELFLAPYPVATPSRVLKHLKSPYFRT